MITERDADRACTARRSRCCTPPTAGWSSSGQPEAPAHPRRPPRRTDSARCLQATSSWNPVSDLDQLFAYHFMVNALAAGTVVAVMAGVVGWFMVLRRQTLRRPHPVDDGVPRRGRRDRCSGCRALAGYFASCTARRAGASARARPPDARRSARSRRSIGTVQAFALALRLPVRQPLRRRSRAASRSLLFGTFLGHHRPARCSLLVVVGVATLALLAAVGRPLLFASVDAPVARGTRRAGRRALGRRSCVLLGLAVAATARSPARCSCSRCWSRPRRPRSCSRRGRRRPLRSRVGARLAVTWLGLASPTSPSTRSASGSRRWRSPCTCSPRRASAGRARRLARRWPAGR